MQACVELLVWAGAMSGVAALALMSQHVRTLPAIAVVKALAIRADAGGGLSLVTRQGGSSDDSRARDMLATRLRMAAASSGGSKGLWEAAGWSVQFDWPRPLEGGAAAYDRGNSQILSAVLDMRGADRPKASVARTEPTVTGSIIAGGRSPGHPAPGAQDGAAPRVEGEEAANGPCELTFAAAPEVNRATITLLHLHSTCGPIPQIFVSYGGRTFDLAPHDDSIVVDLFAGPEPVAVVDPRGGRAAWTPPASVFRGIAKAVLTWSGSADLNLNAQEYSAPPGGMGFLRQSQRGTLEDAALAGRGFLSTIDDGTRGGEHLEVYTFLETANSPRGEVAFGVEAKQCAPAGDARYETYLLVNGVKKGRNRSSIDSVGCALAEQTGGQRSLRGFQARLATPFDPI
jgi:hypothetical protein